MDVEQFKEDIARHEMTIIRDDGVNRHLRFQRPGTMCMHFDLITWPGYLCYTGDMGTYVFRRLEDMFEFFRRDEHDRQFAIDMHYWSEKVEAQDKHSGITKFSPEAFKQAIYNWMDNSELMDDEDLKTRIEEELLPFAGDGKDTAYREAINFEHNGDQIFQDFWEVDCDDFTHRFQWCCNALVWAINKYDHSKVTA